MSALVLQILTGLASASALFLVASGLSLIFGVTRIVNFAHGSFYMLGLYGAVALTDAWGAGPLGFWGGVLVSALAVAALGALIESDPAPALLGARAVPAARDLRARPRHPRRGACAPGARKTCSARRRRR
jgi:branched-subunit amino acid ABC-type transport system permease component